MAHDGGGLAPVPVRRPRATRRRIVLARPEVSVQAPKQAVTVGPRPHPTSLTAPIGRVSPVGRSPSQGNARRVARDEGYRQQIIATRQIQARQAPKLPAGVQGARQELNAGVHVQQTEQRAADRANAIALHQITQLQERTPNPKVATLSAARQVLNRIHTVSEIGRLTKTATDTSKPLGHRVGALRALRSRYGLPVTNENFHAFRQAQAFHDFLHTGKEGDTIALPVQASSHGASGDVTVNGHALRKGSYSQTYQLRKIGGKLVPVAVTPDTSLSLGGLLAGHPYRQHGFTPETDLHAAIQGQSGGIAHGFTHAGLDVANYGTRLIPAGKVGTPIRRGLTEAATLPIQIPTSVYGTGSAIVKAVGGDTRELKAIGKGLSTDDPIGRLITHGDFKAFAKHPGIAVAELLGGVASLDRAAGRVSRGGGVVGLHAGEGTFGRGVAPGLRPVRSTPLTRLAVQDRYSHGLVIAKRQAGHDAKAVADYNAKRSAAISEAMKAEHAKAAGNVEAVTLHQNRAIDLAHQAESINPHRMTAERTGRHPLKTTDFGRLGDVQEGVNQARARSGRTAVLQDLLGRGAVRPSKREPGVLRKGPEGVVQALLSQNVLAPHVADLRAYVTELANAEPHLAHDAEKLNLNRGERAAVLEVANAAQHDPHLLPGLMDDARRYARVNRKVHEEAHAADILPRDEAQMAALKPFAVRRMGAIADSEGVLRVPAHGATHADILDAQRLADAKQATLRSLRGRGSEVSRDRLANAELEAEAAQHTVDQLAPRVQSTQIEAAMREFNKQHPTALSPEEVAFVSHSPGITSPGVFNVRGDSAKGLPTGRRTGAAIRYGHSNPGKDAMVGTVVRLRNMVSAVHSFRDLVEHAAVRYRDGAKRGQVIAENSRAEAERVYRDQFTDPQTGLLRPGYVKGRAVRLNPFGGREQQLARTLDHANAQDSLDASGFTASGGGIHQDIQHALEGSDGEGPWTVIPEPFAQRLADHSKVTAGGSPIMRSLTHAFRITVLPFSPTWLAGNVIEASLRAALIGAGKQSADFEARTIERLAQEKPEVAQRLVLAIGYGHLGSSQNWHVRNTSAALSDTALGPIVDAFKRIEQAQVRGGRPVEATANLVRAYTDWVMNSVNGTFEAGVKRAMAGRFMRDFLTGNEHAGKLTEEAVKAAAHELGSNPAALEELVRFVQRKFGAYEHFSPEMRRWLLNWVPFGAWMMNATIFLVRNLPQDHPGLVALLAANDSATRQWRRDNGLDATTANETGGGQLPPFLQGSIPTPGWYAHLLGVPAGSPLRIARYTPFGLYTDPLSNIGQAFLPQFPLDALQGRTFTGRELRNPDGSPYDAAQKAAYAASQGALATIPIIGQLARFISYGGDVKAAGRVLNPFTPTVPKKPTSDSASGSGYAWGGGGSSSSPSGGWAWNK